MDNELTYVMDMLEKSIKKQGEKPLTTTVLLTILRMAEAQAAADDHRGDMEAAYSDIY